MRIARHKSKAYILAEILIGSVLQAAFIVSLAAGVYWLSMFSVRAHYLLLAREKGERIVAHIDNRIKTCGYGLWKVLEADKLKESLGNDGNPKSSLNPAFSVYSNPIVIYDKDSKHVDEDDETQCGVQFSLLYTKPAQRAEPSGMFIHSKGDHPGQAFVLTGNSTVNYRIINSKKDLSDNIDFIYDDKFKIKSWGVIPSVGIPFYIPKINNTNKDKNLDLQKFFPEDVTIPGVAEVMYLKNEKFFLNGTDFCYQIMNDDNRNSWGNRSPYVSDILRIFCEYHKNEKIFNLYILSSGGSKPAGLEAQERPTNWSTHDTGFNWDNYKSNICYVTRASWKLHNIP